MYTFNLCVLWGVRTGGSAEPAVQQHYSQDKPDLIAMMSYRLHIIVQQQVPEAGHRRLVVDEHT